MNSPARALVVTVIGFLLACSEESPSTSEIQVSSNAVSSATDSAQRIDEFFTSFTDQWMENNPDRAVSSAYFDSDKQNQLEQLLTPWTVDYDRETIQLAREGLTALRALDLSTGTDEQRLSGELMAYMLESLVNREPYLDYIGSPLNQLEGANVSLVTTFTLSHPFQNAIDVENYVTRLRLVDDRMQEATAESARRMALGINLPTFILNNTIEQMRSFSTEAPQENPYISTLIEKSANVTGLEETRRQQLIAEARDILTSEIYPAWQAAIIQLQSQLPTSTDEAGISRFTNGDEIYQNQLEIYTTTDLTAAEIHQIGLDEVTRIEAEMRTLFDQVGITEGTIEERVTVLRAQLAYPDSDTGREQLSADIQDWMADALVRSRQLFDLVPESEVIARAYPEFLWNSRPASYFAAPLDQSRPAVYQFPLRSEQLTQFGKRSTVYHETVPGHHYQLALIAENNDLPRFMRMRAYGGISATTEGWALYAERLAAESGWYEDDIEGRLGQLNSALFRARRLVVDTGLHTLGWTRQQAIDYGISASEVDRYIVRPGQACSYMIGQLKIVELRERARTRLGSNFSIQDFHNTVLGAGVVPLSMLEAIVDDYIDNTETLAR